MFSPILNDVLSTCNGIMWLCRMSLTRFFTPFTRLAPPVSTTLRTAAGLPSSQLLGARASVTSAVRNCACPFSRSPSAEPAIRLLNSCCASR